MVHSEWFNGHRSFWVHNFYIFFSLFNSFWCSICIWWKKGSDRERKKNSNFSWEMELNRFFAWVQFVWSTLRRDVFSYVFQLIWAVPLTCASAESATNIDFLYAIKQWFFVVVVVALFFKKVMKNTCLFSFAFNLHIKFHKNIFILTRNDCYHVAQR